MKIVRLGASSAVVPEHLAGVRLDEGIFVAEVPGTFADGSAPAMPAYLALRVLPIGSTRYIEVARVYNNHGPLSDLDRARLVDYHDRILKAIEEAP